MKRVLILSLLVVAAAAVSVAQDIPISMGDSINGTLDDGDQTLDEDGSLIDWYALNVSGDATFDVLLTSEDFDTFLIVEFPDGNYLVDDDGAGGWSTDSALTVTTSQRGTIRIGVNSYSAGSSGRYTLTLAEAQVLQLRVGQSVDGNLTGSSVVYRLSGTPGEMVQIELTSSYFDTYLSLDDSEGTSLRNDDAGSTTRSRLMHMLASDGMATVTVTAFGGSGGGPFTLSVQEVDIDEGQYEAGYRLSPGERVQAYLMPSRNDFHGRNARLFTFEAQAGDRIEINHRSDDFDCYLGVVGPNGQEWTDDDSGGSLDSRLRMTIQTAGVYQVYATAYSGSSTGAFELEFIHHGQANILASGSGAISRDDPSDIMGRYYDIYEFSSRNGAEVTIDVNSEDFDGYALVRDPSGTIVARDDDGGMSGDPRIEFYAQAGVRYELVITTFSYETWGRYSFSVVE